jgi:hypothetical protein
MKMEEIKGRVNSQITSNLPSITFEPLTVVSKDSPPPAFFFLPFENGFFLNPLPSFFFDELLIEVSPSPLLPIVVEAEAED